MNLNSLLYQTLSSIGPNIPVSYMVHHGEETTYIVYMTYNTNGALYTDEIEVETEYSVQVSVYSTGNFRTVVDEVLARMEAAGFRRNNAYDLYDDDTKRYHKALRFYYYHNKNQGG